MFRALWWKEWRQLRLLRWSGLGIGLLLPPFLLVTAEAGERGWTVFGGIASYEAATVIQEALPKVMALAVWPLLALMTAAQAFAADRAVWKSRKKAGVAKPDGMKAAAVSIAPVNDDPAVLLPGLADRRARRLMILGHCRPGIAPWKLRKIV